MPQRRIRARASGLGAFKFKWNRQSKAKAAVLIAAFLCAVALFAQSAFRIAAGGTVEAELLSLGLPLLYSAAGPVEEAQEPSSQGELPSPIRIDRVDIDAGVSESVRIELLRVEESETPDTPVDLSGSAPRILIYHTHTTEAYFPTSQYDYTPTSAWRTEDNTMNIVTVGERLAELLRDRYGISVIHDITDHEPPKLSTAYSRSVETMEKYKEEYPSITMFIDVHRDAYGNNPQEATDYITIDGKEVARMMFVVGTGEGATGTGFGEKPDFTANYALAKRITEYLSGIDERLMRNIRVKTGRYNQHVSNQCLLVEIGHNANTLEQALNAAEYLAEAIAQVGGIDSAVETVAPPAESALPLTP